MLFGYVLDRSFWGRGLMPEALRFAVDWALAQPEVFRAYAFCDVDNPSSARVMEKAGMIREGVLRRWHVCPNIGPDPRDCILCAKVR
jgi:ribosomal-protein-alanine N-acetyltransferase